MSSEKRKNKQNDLEPEKKSKKKLDSIIRFDGSINKDVLIQIIGDDVERMIIMKLSKVPRYASDLAVDLGISKPAIKKHIDKLMEQGIIVQHSKGTKDTKKEFYCINPNLGFSFRMELSPNFFNYNVDNTALRTKIMIEKIEKEQSYKDQIQISVLGEKPEYSESEGSKVYDDTYTARTVNENDREIIKKLADIEAINQSLRQLGRALREVEVKISGIEHERLNLMLEKNELITRLKTVLNSIIDDPMELELISSFFYNTIENLGQGINIKKFLEDIYLKFKGSRAGVDLEEHIPEYFAKQKDRIKVLEELLNHIIKGFKFIKTVRDPATNEDRIIFDF
jgi:predicted transcriptional regulator